MTKQELKDYLIEEAEIREEEVNEMEPAELLDSWLTYNGIIGFTYDILEAVASAFEGNITDIKNYNGNATE